jgi:3-deoxy-D-manno-octulosonic-acid transferase
MKRVLADIDRFCVQGEETSRRLIELGADPARIIVTGSLKFDSLDSSPIPGRGRERVPPVLPRPPGRPVIMRAARCKGEEEPVIRAFNRVGRPRRERAARHRGQAPETV